MKKVRVTLQGVSALLMHRFPMEEIQGIDKMTKEEQTEIAAYRDQETRELYIPGVCIHRALISGATYVKGKGRGSLTKLAAACIIVEEEYCYLGVKEYVIDSRPVVNPVTKGRMIRHRPRLNNWKVSFTVIYDETVLSEKNMRDIVDYTCSRVGFLDFRPEKRGPFGRAMVVEWKEIK